MASKKLASKKNETQKFSQRKYLSIFDLYHSIQSGIKWMKLPLFERDRHLLIPSLSDLCFELALWTTVPVNPATVMKHDQYLAKTSVIVPEVVQQTYSMLIPQDVVDCITDFLKFDEESEMVMKWGKCGDNARSDQLLEFSNHHSTVRFEDPSNRNPPHSSTSVGGRDYVIVKSATFIPVGKWITINCYVQSVGDEMWIGLMTEKGYHSARSLRCNEHAVTCYNSGGEFQCFGNRQRRKKCKTRRRGQLLSGLGTYHSGDWLKFLVRISKKGKVKQFVVGKGGKQGTYSRGFFSCLDPKLWKQYVENAYFVVELDYTSDCVFVEALTSDRARVEQEEDDNAPDLGWDFVQVLKD